MKNGAAAMRASFLSLMTGDGFFRGGLGGNLDRLSSHRQHVCNSQGDQSDPTQVVPFALQTLAASLLRKGRIIRIC